MFRRSLTWILTLAFLPHLAAVAQTTETAQVADPEATREVEDRFGPGMVGPYRAEHAMVSTSNRYATLAALNTLRAGGNAVDAMAVAQFVLNVAEPYASGIGGGLFMLVYDAERGEVIAIDGREEAPAAYGPDVFLNEEGEVIPFETRRTGGNAVGVPGTLAATARALEEHGTLTLAQALQPAIRLARAGVVIDEPFARNIREHAERLALYPATAALYLHEDGSPREAGEVLRNPDLADTLELIAEQGLKAFYEGEIAQDIVAAAQGDERNPGVLTMEDMAAYQAVRREPVSTDYRGYQVYGMNMPTSGGVTLMLMLNLLEGFELDALDWGSVPWAHRLADAQNLAFADRNAYLGDADWSDIPVQGLLDETYAAERREMMNPVEAIPTPIAPGTPEGVETAAARTPTAREGLSTTHISIVDEDRNVVSVTTTIEQHFGSAIVVPGRGFLLNNELTDFQAVAYDEQGELVPNAAQGGKRPRRTALGEASQTMGGKRPRSSMAPTIVLKDGEPFLALGSPGGSRIIGIVLNVLTNVIDYDMNVQAAINAPRLVARNGPIDLEAPLYDNAALRQALKARGFEVRNGQAFGSVQAILIRENGWIDGGADPRRAGVSLGY